MVGFRMLIVVAFLVAGCFYSNSANAQCGPNGCSLNARPSARQVQSVSPLVTPSPEYRPQGIVFEQVPRVTQRVVLRSTGVVRNVGRRVFRVFGCR